MHPSPPVDALIDTLSSDLNTNLERRGIRRPLTVGIHTGGAWVARRLLDRMAPDAVLGSLDISFYRDDFTRKGMHPEVKPSHLPFDIDQRHVVLVDDVLHTGRTIRAALNELFDYGRPATVTLAVLVERSGRELPIQADAVGMHLDLGPDEHVKLTGPDPLQLVIKQTPTP